MMDIERILNNLTLAACILAAILITLPKSALTQTAADNAYRDAAFSCLNKSKYIWEPTYGNWVERGSGGKIVSSKVVGEALESVKQDSSDPDRAHDTQTGENFFWDKATKTWKNSKTGVSVTSANPREALFCCLNRSRYIWEPTYGNWVERGSGGKIVSAKVVGEALESVKRDLTDPNRAHDSTTGENFFWDKDKGAWRNSKTGECICPKCPPQETGTTTPPKPTPTTTPTPKPTPEPSPTPARIGYFDKRTDIFLGFTYVRAPDEPAKNLLGFNGSAFYNINQNVAVGGDFTAAFGSEQLAINTDVSVARYQYLFGPQFSFHPNNKVKVFVHPLFGGVRDTIKTKIGTTSTSFSANAFAMAFGGGVDVLLNDKVAVRPFQLDYIPTRFGGTWQNNYRVSTGLVFRFGGR